MNDLFDYIEQEILRCKTSRGTKRAAYQHLMKCEGFPANAKRMMRCAISTINRRLIKNQRDNFTNSTKIPLTNLVIRISENILTDVSRTSVVPDEEYHLAVGSLFVEALLQCGYVEITRHRKSDSPYIVELLAKFFEERLGSEDNEEVVLRSSFSTRPPDVDGTYQMVRHSYPHPTTKRFDRSDEDFLARYINNEWVAGQNAMQQTAWKINQEVLAEATKLHNSKEKPDFVFSDVQSQRDNSAYVQVREIIKKAEGLTYEDQFYQLVCLDHRGRAYYTEPFLNFQGCDLARSLMLFKEGEVLTDAGVKHLKSYCASNMNETFQVDNIPTWLSLDYKSFLEEKGMETLSVDKVSVDERHLWVDNNWDLIEKVYEEGYSAIPKTKKPWLFYACCLELMGWKKNPTTFISCLPIPSDGTINCFQHMSAMARDSKLAGLVALKDQEIPVDLYADVGAGMRTISPDLFAKYPLTIPETRSAVSKKHVMLDGYSAGTNTIAKAIAKGLEDDGYDIKYGIETHKKTASGKGPSKVSMELAKSAKASLEQISEDCRTVMRFLKQLVVYEIGTISYFLDGEDKKKERDKLIKRKNFLWAQKDCKSDKSQIEIAEIKEKLSKFEVRLVSGLGNKEIRWVSPCGFPVINREYKTVQKGYKVMLKGLNRNNQVYLIITKPTDIPLRQELENCVAPNMVHSFDSSNLLMVAGRFQYPFAGIHDSIATTANHVDGLRDLNKEVFVEIYEDIGDFYTWSMNQILSRSEGFVKFLEDEGETFPVQGDFDIREVLSSRHFFC